MTEEQLVPAVLAGKRRAAGRVISMIENRDSEAERVIRGLFPHTGTSYVVGLTGPPGAGKSTLADELIGLMRSQGKRVAVLAVDPNSPFTGGAILGDRIRMMRHAVDNEVFIRSMGARGHLGGLARATTDAVRVFDAMGFDYVLVETVGVGQSELEVATQADTVVVVIPPGLGDGVQAIKAGIMEIADIFVVNKADNPHADKTISDIRDLLHMEARARAWSPPIVPTVALRGEGVEDLWMRIRQHREFQESSRELATRRRKRIETEILEIVWESLRDQVLKPRLEGGTFRRTLDAVMHREIDPYAAARELGTETRVEVVAGNER